LVTTSKSGATTSKKVNTQSNGAWNHDGDGIRFEEIGQRDNQADR